MSPARLSRGGLMLLLLGGCVYYNGMYNTKRLAGSARNAEREGRTFEANNLWGQVITRAETLVARHPDSKYADEALVLKGVALARLGQCPAAATPLGRLSLITAGPEVMEEASLAIGRCRLEAGDPAGANLAVSKVLESRDASRRREARVMQARALRLLRRPDEAVAALEGVSGSLAADQRLLALAAAGRQEQALALSESLFAVRDSLRGWDSLVTTVGNENPAIATLLVDRLGARPTGDPALHARRLLEDGARLAPRDSARAVARWRQAAQVGAATEPANRARLLLLRADLARARTPEDIKASLRATDSILQGQPGTPDAVQLRATLRWIDQALDSAAARADRSDLRLFIAAETTRDSLGARHLSATLFRRIVDQWPDSPYAPKALLAGQVLDSAWADTARALLAERYAASPYVAFLRGEDAQGYQQLEDSLQSFTLQVDRQAGPGEPRVRRPAEDAPGLRRRPAQPGQRPRREILQ